MTKKNDRLGNHEIATHNAFYLINLFFRRNFKYNLGWNEN